MENSNIAINDNLIVNCQNGGASSQAVFLSSNTTTCSIIDNTVYENETIIPSSGDSYAAIRVEGSGSGFTISDNKIGGSTLNCGGNPWTKTNVYDNNFKGIFLTTSLGVTSNINNNKINNFNWSNSNSNPWSGIEVAGTGNVNIGTLTGNIIGSGIGNDSILYAAATNGASVYGVKIESTGTVNCQNNTIGGITATNVPTLATNIYGIYKSAVTGNTTISNNDIGSTVTSNSLFASSSSSGNSQYVYGIYSAGSANIEIINNTISNISNANTSTGFFSYGVINGIKSTSGTNIITNNTIKNLTISNGNTTADEIASICGISLSGATTKTVSGNTIYNLTNNYASFTGNVIGLYFIGSLGTNIVSQNFIHSLNVSSSSASVYGIKIGNGVTTYSNNIVSLDGSTNTVLYGIYEKGSSGNNNSLYFNTVYVGGSVNSGTAKSYALYSTTTSNTKNIRNNIFMNARSTTGGSNLHYAAYFNYSTNSFLTLNYNDYYVSGTGGVLGYYGGSNKTTLPLVVANDSYSYVINPNFLSAGSTLATNYSISSDLPGLSGTGSVTIDFGENARSAITSMGAWENEYNKWTGAVDSDWNNSGNWSKNFVPEADANIIFHDSPLNNCVQDQDRSVTDIFNSSGKYTVINGKKLTVKGRLNFGVDARINATDTNSELEFGGAQQQEIPSSSLLNNEVYNMTVNNSLNVKLNGTLKILNTFSSTSGLMDAISTSPTVSYSGLSAQLIENAFVNSSVYDLIIDNASGVSLNTDLTVTNNLTINSGKALTIPTEKLLSVNSSIINNAGAAGLLIRSSSTVPNGSLIFHNPSETPVPATVEMYSKAAKSTTYKWQFIGIPLQTLDKSPTFVDGVNYVRKYNEAGTGYGYLPTNHWIQLQNGATLNPFDGYEITQLNPQTYSFGGNLVNEDYSSGQLAYTSTAEYPGQHLIGNPYTAAINISDIAFGTSDEGIMENSVYLYNTGSYADWTSAGSGAASSTESTVPGQWVVIPKSAAGTNGLPSQIPSMQAFLVKVLQDNALATLSIPYSSVVTKNASLQRAARTEKTSIRIDVKGTGFTDNLWLISEPTCTRDYDNGWDGYKVLGHTSAPQIFAEEEVGNLQVNSVNDFDNTLLGFVAGTDTEYTMKFNHINVSGQYPSLYLVDLQNGNTVDISENGSTYTFSATNTSAPETRFKIITTPEVSTGIQNIKAGLQLYNKGKTVYLNNNTNYSGVMTICDISGRILEARKFRANENFSLLTNLVNGMYILKAETSVFNKSIPIMIK